MRYPQIQPNGENASIEELEVAIEAAPNKRTYIRLAVIRSLLLGMQRKALAQQFMRSERMIRLWIHLFNEGGIDALLPKQRPGRPRKVKLKRLQELLIPLLENPQEAAQVHWTGVKIHGFLKQQLQVQLGYRSVIRYLHQLNYRLRVPRRWASGQDEQARQRFLEELECLSRREDVTLWFGDECGVEGDPRPRRRWVERGSRPKVPYHGKHVRESIIGAVRPDNGELFSLVVNGCDTDVFQFFLDQMAEAVPAQNNKRAILVLDNATWHRAKRLNWHHFEPKFLPAYSPDLNPIERLWLRLKADFFTDFVTADNQVLTQRICKALNAFIDKPDLTASICSIRKFF